jgi:hypothetical protein
MRVILAAGSAGRAHAAWLSRWPLRCRSGCFSAAALGVAIPLASAIRVSSAR